MPGDVVTPGELPGMLTDGLEVDLAGVANRFSEHALKRVEAIRKAVGMARLMQHMAADTAPEEEGVPTPLDDAFDALVATLADISAAQLRSWTKQATGLKMNIKSLVNLMIRYIGLDRALRKIEPSTTRLEVIIDKWKQDYYVDEIQGNREPTSQLPNPITADRLWRT